VDLNDDGSLYFGTDGEGVIRIHPDAREFSRLFIEEGPRQSASWIILEGPGGLLWFHEQEGCMFDTFQPRSGEWRPVFPPMESYPFPLTIDQDGGMWLGGDNGLWVFHLPNEQVQYSTRNGLPDDYVTDVAFSPEGIWVATGDGLALMRGDVVAEVFFADQMGAFSNEFEVLLFARDGSLWAATSEMELLRRHPNGEWEHFTVGNPFSDAFYGVYDLVEDRIGGIWVATSGDGAYRFFDGHWEHFAPFEPGVEMPSFEVNDVSVAPDGSVWFGTDNGAARFDGEGWSHFGVENGLAHWNVNEVYVDRGGVVWFATSGGVSRFGP
jgi:ligand-binding sensor domain-containing protein